MLAVLGYMVCSSTLLILNKLSIEFSQATTEVLFLQCVASTLVAYALSDAKFERLSQFRVVSIAFLATLFANMKILQNANVETFIIFRNSTPIVISVLDWCFMGRELPSLRSAVSIAGMFSSSIAYSLTDSNFSVTAYVWVFMWYLLFCFDQIYIKRVIDSVVVKSNWERVFYINFWAMLFSALYIAFDTFLVVGYQRKYHHLLKSFNAMSTGIVCSSIVAGVAMSYFSLACRTYLSATCFTVVGNVCKFITVIINIIIWDKHASVPGLCFLGICILSATLYQQAPVQKKPEELNSMSPLV